MIAIIPSADSTGLPSITWIDRSEAMGASPISWPAMIVTRTSGILPCIDLGKSVDFEKRSARSAHSSTVRGMIASDVVLLSFMVIS